MGGGGGGGEGRGGILWGGGGGFVCDCFDPLCMGGGGGGGSERRCVCVCDCFYPVQKVVTFCVWDCVSGLSECPQMAHEDSLTIMYFLND